MPPNVSQINNDTDNLDMMHVSAQTSMSYNKDHRSITRLIKIQTAVITILCIALFSFILDGKPENSFYAMSFEGYTRELQPFKEPYIDARTITSWAAKVSGQMFTLGFNDYAERLGSTRQYFTDSGWESFVMAIRTGGLIESITKKQQLLTTVAQATPTITFEGVRNADYVWEVSVPLVITARAGNYTKTSVRNLLVTIVRVPPEDSISGMKIKEIILL